MSKCCDGVDIKCARVAICGVDMPVTVADELLAEHEQSDAELNDLVNDYIMLNPSVSLSLVQH